MNVMLEWAVSSVLGSPSTQAGAIDVVAVRKPDGTISCSPFHVKLGRTSKKGEKKIVNLKVNGKSVELSMKLGPAGEAFFVERTREFTRQEANSLPCSPYPRGVDVLHPISSKEKLNAPFPVPQRGELGIPAQQNLNCSDYSLLAGGAESSAAAGQSGYTAKCRVRSFSDSDLHSKQPQSAVYTQEMKPSTFILAAGSAVVHDHGVGLRARAASDMSELLCASQRTTISANAVSNSGYLQTDSPAAAASAEAWMWKWGTLPKKKRTKSCASDLQGLAHQSTSAPPPSSSSSGAVHGDRTPSDSRGRSVSLPLLALMEENKYTHARHRRRHSPKGKQYPLFQTVTAVEADIPSAHSVSRLNADEAGAAEDFALMHAAAAQDTSAFHSLSLCGDCLLDSAASPPNTQELWRLLEERRITPRDIVSIGGPPERALMRSPDLVVILQDYLLPVPIAEHLLVLLKDRSDQEDSGDEWLGEELQKFLTASNHTWPEWACRRISQWGSNSETRVDAHPDYKELTWARIPWQESFSDLVQAYRVQDIHSIHHMYAAGAAIADKELFAASPLLQDMVSVGHGKHALSYRELWHRQQQQQQTIGANMSFTALLTLDAGHSSSLYCDYHDLGKWHSEDAHDGYGVGYALHTDRASEGSESQHSLPMLVGLGDDHLHSGLLPASVLDSADARTVPVTPAPTVATSPFPAATYMHDAPYRSLSNRAPASSFDGDSSQAEGDTDTDNISLQDIDLDDISPEPAGGDFYESDTDSYLSLSLEEEDMGGAAGAGAFISGAKAGTPAPLGSPQGAGPTGIPLMRRRFKRYRYRKVLVPSQEQLEMLNLQEGPNDIAFELEGCAPLKSCLFVWPSDARIVVTDLAGIFSKSNRNSGVWISFLGGGSYYSSTASKTEFDSCIRLFAGLHQQGYRIIYMAQGAQSSATSPSAALLSSQEYLSSIKASTGESLPPGPVFKSPDSLVRAFGAARTEVFKASALRGVKSLFPSSHNPYHACFCTRESDAIPFARFGFSEGRIFLVSENGDIKSANRTCVLSFPRLSELLHQIFPLVIDSQFEARKLSASSSTAKSSQTAAAHIDATVAVLTAAAAIAGNGDSSKAPFSTDTAAAASSALSSPLLSIHTHAPTTSASAPVTTPSSAAARTLRGSTDDTYNDFNFWKVPLPAIEDEFY